MSALLKGKVAVVTGGSRGIGLAAATRLAEEGASVLITARDQRELAAAAVYIREHCWSDLRQKIGRVTADVSDPKGVRAIVAAAKKIGPVDILVTAAGIQAPIGPFAENDLAAWKKNIEVNLLGTVMVAQAFLPQMRRRKRGKIVTFAGGGATGIRENFSAYAAAKIGVVKFTEIIAAELRPFRIEANAISPGAVHTAMAEEVLRIGRRAGAKELAAARASAHDPQAAERAADLVLFLASSRSNGLTGRLVSAKFDPWQKWDRRAIAAIAKSERYTLRRIT